MPTIQVEVQLSSAQLLRSAEQLSPAELEEFVAGVLALKAARTAPCVPGMEAELLQTINRPAPLDAQRRFDALNVKRRSGPLSDEEHSELIYLIDRLEALDVERVKALSELARLRRTPLKTLMRKLHIRTPNYV